MIVTEGIVNRLLENRKIREATTGITMNRETKNCINLVAKYLDNLPVVSCEVSDDNASITYRKEKDDAVYLQRVEIVRVPEYHVHNYLGDEVIVAHNLQELEQSMIELAKEELK